MSDQVTSLDVVKVLYQKEVQQRFGVKMKNDCSKMPVVQG